MAMYFRTPFADGGDRTAIPNDSQPDGSMSYTNGFTPDYQLDYPTDPTAKPVPRLDINEVLYQITLALQQYQTHGVPDFINAVDNGGFAYPYDKFALVRYDDGSGIQLFMSNVDANTTTPMSILNWSVFSPDGVPPGAGIDFYGATMPFGRWLVRNGAIVLIASYPRLYASIGTLWGGNGVTTFGLPSSSRRVAVGSGGTGSAVLANTVGSVGGAETDISTIAQMPTHHHAGSNIPYLHDFLNSASGLADVVAFTGASFFQPVTITPEGGNQPHTLMQPSEVCLKLIKY